MNILQKLKIIIIITLILYPNNAYSLENNILLSYKVTFVPSIKEKFERKKISNYLNEYGSYKHKETYLNTPKYIRFEYFAEDTNFTIFYKKKERIEDRFKHMERLNHKIINIPPNENIISFDAEIDLSMEIFDNTKNLKALIYNPNKIKSITKGEHLNLKCDVIDIERITEYLEEEIKTKYITKIKIWYSKKLDFPVKVEYISEQYQDNTLQEFSFRVREVTSIEYNKLSKKKDFIFTEIKQEFIEKYQKPVDFFNYKKNITYVKQNNK
jgi:hypothetical protein